METTTKWGIKYPSPTDLVSGASQQFETMAESIDQAAQKILDTSPLGTVRTTTVAPATNPTVTIVGTPYTSRTTTFNLPRASRITGITTTPLGAGSTPTATLTTDANGDTSIQLGLPKATHIYGITAKELPAGSTPTVTTEQVNGNPSELFITIGLPKPRSINDITVTSIDSTSAPTITKTQNTDGDLNLALGIPKAVAIGGEGYTTGPGLALQNGALSIDNTTVHATVTTIEKVSTNDQHATWLVTATTDFAKKDAVVLYVNAVAIQSDGAPALLTQYPTFSDGRITPNPADLTKNTIRVTIITPADIDLGTFDVAALQARILKI